MSLIISWTDYSAVNDGTRIYRSDVPFDAYSLPVPIATVGPGVTQYEDTDVVQNKLYYYRLGNFYGNDEVLTKQLMLADMPYTGPGPTKPKIGDYEYGLFGVLSPGEVFGGQELIDTVGLSGYTVPVDPEWMKVAIGGKILFVPIPGICRTLSWKELYDKGLVYGTNDNGLVPTDTPTNQYTTIMKGEQEFII